MLGLTYLSLPIDISTCKTVWESLYKVFSAYNSLSHQHNL